MAKPDKYEKYREICDKVSMRIVQTVNAIIMEETHHVKKGERIEVHGRFDVTICGENGIGKFSSNYPLH